MRSVKARMVVLVVSVLVALVTTLGIAEWMGGQVTSRYESMVRGPLAARQVASELETHVVRYGALLMTHIAEHDPAKSGRLEAMIEAEHSAIAALLDRVNSDADLRAAFNGRTERIRDQATAYKTATGPALAASRADQAKQALTLYEQQVVPARELLFATLAEMDTDLAKKAEDAVAAVQGLIRVATVVKYAVAVLGVFAVVGIGLLVARGLLRSTREVVRVSSGIAAGDLTVRFVTSGDDELNRAGMQLNKAVDALSAMIAEVAETCVTLSRAAEAVGGMAEDLDARAKETDDRASAASAGGEEVRRSVTTLSTGAEEMTASIKEISKNAAEAAEYARTAVGTARQSKETVARLDQSSKEIGEVLKTITEIAAGDLTVRFVTSGDDELNRAGMQLNKAVDALSAMIAEVAETCVTLSRAAEAVGGMAEDLDARAKETDDRASAASAGGEEVRRSVTTLSTGAEEMTASIKEISKNAAEAAEYARTAVGTARQSKETVARLDQSSKEIGEVLKTITEIAEQTNLLALNATIEAARAGEMGKGFAVVANEVKSLATQTARATGDIASRINSVRTNTTEAVAAMDRVSEVVGRICEFQSTIASAVEEQTATTNEMGRSIAEAAAGSGDIARNVAGVATSVQAVYAASKSLRASVEEVNASAERMRAKVSTFKTDGALKAGAAVPASASRAGGGMRRAA